MCIFRCILYLGCRADNCRLGESSWPPAWFTRAGAIKWIIMYWLHVIKSISLFEYRRVCVCVLCAPNRFAILKNDCELCGRHSFRHICFLHRVWPYEFSYYQIRCALSTSHIKLILFTELFSSGPVCNTSTGDVGFCVHIDSCFLSAGNSTSRVPHSNILNATESACNPLNDTNIVCCPRYGTVKSIRVEQHKRKLIEEFVAKVGQCGMDNLDRSKEFPWTVQIFHQKLSD